MEIVLKQGDRIRIPEGCVAQIDGNEVVIEKKEQEFKDGDVLATTKCVGTKTILIFKGKESRKNSFRSHFNSSGLNEEGWAYPLFRYATDEEKQALFDKMKEKGLQWNAEEKRVEKIRCRAKNGEKYYIVNDFGHVVADEESGLDVDRLRWAFGNYFHTHEQAEKAAAAVKETLRKFNEENE